MRSNHGEDSLYEWLGDSGTSFKRVSYQTVKFHKRRKGSRVCYFWFKIVDSVVWLNEPPKAQMLKAGCPVFVPQPTRLVWTSSETMRGWVELRGVEVGHRDITLRWKTGPRSFSFLLPGCHEASSFLCHTTVAWRATPIINGFSVSCMTTSLSTLSSLFSPLTLMGFLTPSCGVYLSQMPGYPESSNVFIASLTQKPQSLLCSLSLY